MLEYSLIDLYGNERRWFVGFHFTYLRVGGVYLYLKDNRSTISNNGWGSTTATHPKYSQLRFACRVLINSLHRIFVVKPWLVWPSKSKERNKAAFVTNEYKLIDYPSYTTKRATKGDP